MSGGAGAPIAGMRPAKDAGRRCEALRLAHTIDEAAA